MTTLSTLPVYPVPARQTAVIFTLTESGSNYVRVWCTAAPPGSELRKALDGTSDPPTEPRSRHEVYKGDGGADKPLRRVFETGGRYVLVAQEYTKNATAFGGGYEGDPDGYESETKVGSEATLELFIGQRMTSEIRVAGESVTVVLWVWDDTIRATTVATHGEKSPTLLATSPTVKVQAAMESAAVIAALAALADDAVTTAIGTPATILGNGAGGFTKEWNDHLADTAPHATADTENGIPTGLASAASADNLSDTVNECLLLIRYHYTNDAVKAGADPPGAGRDTGDYHVPAAVHGNDNVNMPLFRSVGDPRDAYWAVADIHRSYEAHRVSAVGTGGIHDSPDSTNVLTALPSLLALGSAVFTVWAATSPTTPATQSDGAMALIAKAGFTETPLQG
jgi:hypothetical protein